MPADACLDVMASADMFEHPLAQARSPLSTYRSWNLRRAWAQQATSTISLP
jgi:hypothetical protein